MTDQDPKPTRPRRLQIGELVPFVATGLGNGDGAEATTPGDRRKLRVQGALPGEEGLVQLRHVGQHAIWGVARSVDKPAAERVDAPCPVVLDCGGCPWQMADLALQRAVKAERIRAALGELPEDAAQTWWPGPAPLAGYRTRALMMAGRKERRLALGFFAPSTRHFVAAEPCEAQHPLLNRTLEGVLGVLRRIGVQPRHDERGRGDLRAVQLRMHPDQPEGLLLLVVNDVAPWRNVARQLLAIPGVAGVYAASRTDADGAVLADAAPEHLAGATHQPWPIGADVLEIGPSAFVQTHSEQADALLTTVLGLLPAETAHLVDAYAGVGVFGLAARHRARRVTLLERDGAATADARHNLTRLDGCDHVAVHTADAGAWGTELAASEATALILDPPRAGCDAALLGAIPASCATVVLISCGLPGLGRDAARLRELGWRCDHLAAHDLFPHTPHAEVVTRWIR